jgi:signal peptidase II
MAAPRPTYGRFLLAAAILCSCIGCDQATKSLATHAFKNCPPQVLLGGTIRLQYAQNPGGFLSLGTNLPEEVRRWFFVGLNAAIMLAVLGVLVFRHNIPLPLFIALASVLAGGIGNLIDRVTNNGLVTDFINVGIGPLRTGIFNIADIAVTFGGIAVVLLASGGSRVKQLCDEQREDRVEPR